MDAVAMAPDQAKGELPARSNPPTPHRPNRHARATSIAEPVVGTNINGR